MTEPADDTDTPARIALTAVGSESAPFVYCDGVLTFGHNQGNIQIELAANTIVPTSDGGTKTEVVVTAHLRCSPAAAVDLRRAIDNALLLLAPVQGPESKPN